MGRIYDATWGRGFSAELTPELDIFDPLGTEVVHGGKPIGEVGLCLGLVGSPYVVAQIDRKHYWP